MARENLNDLQAFVEVARERSFTKAAAKLGVSPSALSHSMRSLEERMGIRLLTRTTRSVSPTEAGERVLATLAQRLDDIEAELAEIAELRSKPVGKIRITSSDHAVDAYILPKLSKLLLDYPELEVEIAVDYAFTDIVENRFDVGIRLGDQVAKDMIAVRIAPDMRMAVVGAPGYLALHTAPMTPRDLTNHNCINLRLPTGGMFGWKFEKGGESVNVRVEGQMAFNTLAQLVAASAHGLGLAYVAEDYVRAHIAAGTLVPVLREWCPTFPGFHMYYPSRRQSSRVMTLLVEALRG
jgi:DNA-binding transcriptional LysR family regulator